MDAHPYSSNWYVYILEYLLHDYHYFYVVQRAESLLVKGKNNTNDCFVTIALGKTKYRTSVKEKAGHLVEWHEECEL